MSCCALRLLVDVEPKQPVYVPQVDDNVGLQGGEGVGAPECPNGSCIVFGLSEDLYGDICLTTPCFKRCDYYVPLGRPRNPWGTAFRGGPAATSTKSTAPLSSSSAHLDEPHHRKLCPAACTLLSPGTFSPKGSTKTNTVCVRGI